MSGSLLSWKETSFLLAWMRILKKNRRQHGNSAELGASLTKRIHPTFAYTDVKTRPNENGLVTYQFKSRPYQHREFLGWMGFVPANITHDHIRDAHAVYPAEGLGTVIVSVPGIFYPADDAQVDKAHRVEMSLASYDLSPVLDPNLKVWSLACASGASVAFTHFK